MRALRWTLAALGLALAPAAAQAQIGTPADDYLDYDDYGPAVAEYYGAPLERMPAWIDPDELPVIYLLAREAGVSPRVIIALREQGWSWIDITYHLGIDPTLYVERLPYSSGYWRRYSAWELRYLSDRHIIDYVNLCFWADYHRRPIRQVIIIRQRVPSWRYYARYHAPPRSVPRGVWVRRSTRPDSPRRDTPRYAVPRDDSRRGVGEDRRAEDRRERSAQPPRSAPGTGQPQPVRRDQPGTEGPPRRAEEREASPRRTGERDEARQRTEGREAAPRRTEERDIGPTRSREARPAASDDRDRSRPTASPARQAEPPRREAVPARSDGSRREAAPARSESPRREAAPARSEPSRSTARRSDDGARNTAAPSTRSSGSSRDASSSRSGSGRRGN
jgi:hypothetical protein